MQNPIQASVKQDLPFDFQVKTEIEPSNPAAAATNPLEGGRDVRGRKGLWAVDNSDPGCACSDSGSTH